MDFFAQQAKVRRSSRWLVVLFVLAVVAVIVAVDIVCVLAFGWYARPSQAAGAGAAVQGASLQLDWIAIAEVSVAVLVLIVLASLYRAASLRGGGAVVARGMGATPVPADTGNPTWRRLRNVIEEVAIASGVPVPDIFVLEGEPGINAFAAGYTPSDAAVCVTQGCLDRLTRDELQGVIAHEFSHVLNGDMRLNIRLMGLLFGILVLGIVGRYMMFSGAGVRSRGNTAYLALIGIAVIVVGYVGYFFGRLIQAAVSRSRESLADASAVQFTRQTDGIAGALKKIAALEQGSRLAAHNKHEVAHMLFGEAGGFSRLFATHPPLPERLQALGVAWDDNEMRQLARAWQQPRHASDPTQASASLSGFAPSVVSGMVSTAATTGTMLPDAEAKLAVDAVAVSAQVAAPGAGAFDLAGVLRERLPVDVEAAVKHPRQARALLLALAMDRDPSVRDAQLLTIDNTLGSDCAEDAEHALAQLIGVHPMQRLPLAALVFPALRRRPRPELEQLLDTLCALVQVDHSVDLHEYCLVRLLDLQLRDLLDPSSGFIPGRKRLRSCRQSLASLLALVAGHGHPGDDQAAQRAWTQALSHVLPDARIAFALPDNWQAAMDRALHELDAVRVRDKQRVVQALAMVVSEDGVVTVAEAELLRVICASLHCPVPLLDARPVSA